WGDDGGPSAFGVIADVVLPTAARGLGNHRVAPRAFLPLDFELGEAFEVGAMTGCELREQEPGGGRRPVFINSVTVVRKITKRVDGYLELFSEAGPGPHVMS